MLSVFVLSVIVLSVIVIVLAMCVVLGAFVHGVGSVVRLCFVFVLSVLCWACMFGAWCIVVGVCAQCVCAGHACFVCLCLVCAQCICAWCICDLCVCDLCVCAWCLVLCCWCVCPVCLCQVCVALGMCALFALGVCAQCVCLRSFHHCHEVDFLVMNSGCQSFLVVLRVFTGSTTFTDSSKLASLCGSITVNDECKHLVLKWHFSIHSMAPKWMIGRLPLEAHRPLNSPVALPFRLTLSPPCPTLNGSHLWHTNGTLFHTPLSHQTMCNEIHVCLIDASQRISPNGHRAILLLRIGPSIQTSMCKAIVSIVLFWLWKLCQ